MHQEASSEITIDCPFFNSPTKNTKYAVERVIPTEDKYEVKGKPADSSRMVVKILCSFTTTYLLHEKRPVTLSPTECLLDLESTISPNPSAVTVGHSLKLVVRTFLFASIPFCIHPLVRVGSLERYKTLTTTSPSLTEILIQKECLLISESR